MHPCLPRAAAPHRPFEASTDLHLDAPRLGVRLLGNAQVQHAVLQVGLDAAGVQLAAEGEGAAVARQAHLGIDRLQALGRELRHGAFDQQGVAFDLELQLLARHAGQVGQQRDAGLVFQNVHARQQGSRVLAFAAARALAVPGRCGGGCRSGLQALEFDVSLMMCVLPEAWGLRGSLHRDALGLGRLAARQAHLKHAVAVAGMHLGGVHVVRQADRPLEAAAGALAAVDAAARTFRRRGGTLA